MQDEIPTWVNDVVDVARVIPNPHVQFGVGLYDLVCKYMDAGSD